MTPRPPAPPVYAALGDSISIDDYAGGPGRGGASLLFRNRDDDFPAWQGRDLTTVHPGARLALLAADGATTRTLLDVQLPRLAASGLSPDLVTVTVGGNDLLSAYGDTERARLVVRSVADALARALDELRPRLAPDARIAVGTVYDPSDGTGDASRLGLPPWPDGVAVLGELNEALRGVARGAGAAVAEIAQGFAGHGVLAGNVRSADPRPASRDLWLCQVIEPNAWGADGVRAAFWAALGGAPR